MPASIHSLSPAILDLIIAQLLDTEIPDQPKPYILAPQSSLPVNQQWARQLASYALVCRRWRDAVERHTLSAIKSYTEIFPHLKKTIGACPHSQRYVKQLFYNIDLPPYSTARQSNFETRAEHHANLNAFRKGFLQLWNELSAWTNVSPRGIALDLEAEPPGEFNPFSQHQGIGKLRWSQREHTLTLHDIDEKPPYPA